MKNYLPAFFLFSTLFFFINAKEDDVISQMTKLAKEYEAVSPSGDSVFAVKHCDYHSFAKDFFREDNSFINEDRFKNAKIRDVVGPFKSERTVNIYKILERRVLPDSCEVRIIWVAHKDSPGKGDKKITRSKPESFMRADSIRNLIVSGKVKMEDIVQTYTDDPGSLSNNGNYGWLVPEMGFVSELKYIAFTMPPGTTTIFDSYYGYYVIQMLTHSKTSHPYTIVSTITRKLPPGNNR